MQQVQKDPKGLPQPTDKELKLINQEFNVFLDDMDIEIGDGLDSGTDAKSLRRGDGVLAVAV